MYASLECHYIIRQIGDKEKKGLKQKGVLSI